MHAQGNNMLWGSRMLWVHHPHVTRCDMISRIFRCHAGIPYKSKVGCSLALCGVKLPFPVVVHLEKLNMLSRFGCLLSLLRRGSRHILHFRDLEILRGTAALHQIPGKVQIAIEGVAQTPCSTAYFCKDNLTRISRVTATVIRRAAF